MTMQCNIYLYYCYITYYIYFYKLYYYYFIIFICIIYIYSINYVKTKWLQYMTDGTDCPRIGYRQLGVGVLDVGKPRNHPTIIV